MKFKEICQVINGRAYKLDELLQDGKYPVLRVGNFFTNNEVLYSDLELAEEKYCVDGDLLFAWSASFGPKIFHGDKTIYHYHIWKLIPDKRKVDKEYLYFWLLNNTRKLKASVHGSVMVHMTKADMENQDIDLPSLVVQKKISYILSTLDKKVAVNTLINKNLAAQIKTSLNQLLATGDQNSQIRFGDLLYIKGRIGWKGLKKDEYLEKSNFMIINGESLTTSGIDWTKTGFITQERYDESPEIMLKPDDILLSKDGTIGKIGYITSLKFPTTVASGIFVIRNSMKGEYGAPFLYYLLESNRFKGFVKGRIEGSVIPHLYQKDFVDFTFPKPNPDELKRFNDFSQPIFKMIQNNLQENRHLEEVRDRLLPKLLSGEIEIK